jgi:hypothetical protein
MKAASEEMKARLEAKTELTSGTWWPI